MDASSSPPDHIARAYHLCKKHGLFFTEVIDRIYDRRAGAHKNVRGWVVYRPCPGGGRPTRLGRRRNEAALLAFVKKLIAAAQPKGEQHATPA